MWQGAGVSSWRDDRPDFSTEAYDARWRQLEASGQNPHGEADLVMSYGPRSVLDAGCGTGRVAIELARRGVDVTGVDVDPDMLDTARAKAPQLDWKLADLAELELARSFDVAVAAGNVMIFVAEQSRAGALAAIARHLAPGGLLIAGFQQHFDARHLLLADYDRMAAAAGLELTDRFATWERAPYTGGSYAVSVHRKTA